MRGFAPNPRSKLREAPAKIVNALIHGLNEKPDTKYAAFLPRFIIIAPDWDVIKYIGHYKYGFTIIAQMITNWMVEEVNKAIQKRKDDLQRIKSGATIQYEPKVVWIKMVDRVSQVDKALAVRHKFNSILEDTLVDYSGHFILDVSSTMKDPSFFIEAGVAREGAIRFWLEVNDIIEKFDKREISLNPIKSSENQTRFKMPPPPPRRKSPQRKTSPVPSHKLHRRINSESAFQRHKHGSHRDVKRTSSYHRKPQAQRRLANYY